MLKLNKWDDLAQELDEAVSNHLDNRLDGELKVLREEIKKQQVLKVVTDNGDNLVNGVKHMQLPSLINMVGAGLNVMLTGSAGSGKTHASAQAAEALGVKFYALSVGAQTSKSDIVGFIDAGGTYRSTPFRQAYEKGGVFVMDEIDAGNSNVLIQINSALSNGICSFPDKQVKAHKDFHFIATANTYGKGESMKYVGRNRLDVATLDRFTIIHWNIDEKVERAIAGNDTAMYKAIIAARSYCERSNIDAMITPRTTQKAVTLHKLNWSVKAIWDIVLKPYVPSEYVDDVVAKANEAYEHSASSSLFGR
jgi:hypothetical protein|nr:MAG TPA: ATPase-like protein [Caudoviricetes sp.]